MKCTKCECDKNETEFRKRKNSKTGYNYWCRDCENTANRERYKPKFKTRKSGIKNTIDIKLSAKKRMLKYRYNLSIEDYVIMYNKQGCKCAICKRDYPLGGKKGLYVDHDHNTCKVRGLLCSSCNSAIGKLRESETILINAIAYLKNK